MRDDTPLALRPDLFGQLAATDPFQGRARRLYERGQVLAVNGNQADVRVGYDARNNPLDLKEVPIVSGYIPRAGDWVAIQYEAGHSGAPWVAGPSMAADESEDTPGIGVFSVSSEEPTDPPKSTVYFHEPASTWRGWNGAAWVDLGGGGGGLHNSLPDLQGGAAGEYYHLTAAQWNVLVGNMPFGAGGLIYADGDGKLKTDAALTWDSAGLHLTVVGDGFRIYRENFAALFRGFVYSNTAGHRTHLVAYRYRGTRAAPSSVLSGDDFFSLSMTGYDAGGASYGSSYWVCEVSENWGDAANRGVRWRFYQTYTGEATYTEWMNWESGQIRIQNGSADDPAYSFLPYPTTGIFSPADGRVAVTCDRVQTATVAADGLGIGIDPAGSGRRLYVYKDYDGAVSHAYQNASTHADAGYYIYLLTGGGGDLYHRYVCPGSQYWAYGIRQSDDKWVWSNYIDLSTSPTTYDRMTLDRNGVLWLRPHSPTLTADGQAAMDSVHDTWAYRFNAKKMLGAALFDDARVADVTVYDSGGTLAEQAISTHTVESGFSAAGNTVKVVAKGTARVNPKGAGGGATMHIILRIEGTNVLDLSFAAAQAQPATWIHWEFSFEATMRSSTSWEISNVKAGYATWQQVGNPWPCTFTPTEMWYGRDTTFTVSGDVTTQVRCSISNSAPGTSYITVAKHQAGLEQT